MRESIHQEDITTINIYALNIGVPKYITQILTELKGEINNTIIAGNFNSPFSTIDSSSRQKVNKETLGLNHTLEQMELRHTEYFTQQQQNTHTSQAQRKHFQGYIT